MNRETFQIDIPDTQSGRIYVGLSWDDIFDKTTAKNLRKSDIERAMITALLKPKIISFYVVLFVFVLSAYWQLTLFSEAISFSWTIALSLILVTAAAFTIYIRASTKKGSVLLSDNQQKNEDLPGRDEKYDQFDIDLHCFVYDKNKSFLFEINPADERLLNPDEPVTVYHSGEETDGAGVYDDETIHIEIKKLQDNYRYFVFAVANDCAHNFDKINNLTIRLADSKTDKTALKSAIASNEADGYAFCCVYKNGDRWMCQHIGKYLPFNEKWQEKITDLLKEIK